ncbi:MAG: 50S ribosomal protein L6 [Kiritimatiellia bacterium]
MSRVGKQPVLIPSGVQAQVSGCELAVKGPKGQLKMAFPATFQVTVQEKFITIAPRAEDEEINALHGLYRSLVANMVHGVAVGYLKELEIQGVGFKAAVQGKKAIFNLGFSSPVEVKIPDGIDFKVAENVRLAVSGPDKQQVGDFAAHIKDLFPAEPYKGKGIRFKGEYVRRKVGKTVA